MLHGKASRPTSRREALPTNTMEGGLATRRPHGAASCRPMRNPRTGEGIVGHLNLNQVATCSPDRGRGRSRRGRRDTSRGLGASPCSQRKGVESKGPPGGATPPTQGPPAAGQGPLGQEAARDHHNQRSNNLRAQRPASSLLSLSIHRSIVSCSSFHRLKRSRCLALRTYVVPPTSVLPFFSASSGRAAVFAHRRRRRVTNVINPAPSRQSVPGSGRASSVSPAR